MSDRKDIIMNFSAPPLIDDIRALAIDILGTLPSDLLEYVDIDNIDLIIEEFPDLITEEDMELDSPYDLLALYKKEEILPGAIKKSSDNNNKIRLVLYRRPILDAWCDTNENLKVMLRYIIITEISQNYGFSEKEIDQMIEEHYQGLFLS